MRRYMPVAMALIFSIVPLFPSFIALSGVAFPGVSLLPSAAVFGVFALCALLAFYTLAMFARYPA
ncbi:MAG: hypothetical protein WBV40_13040, partial [Candidatus Cybelea sp.]